MTCPAFPQFHFKIGVVCFPKFQPAAPFRAFSACEHDLRRAFLLSRRFHVRWSITKSSGTPPNVDSFLKQIDAIWAKYQKPIWITEFAVADWAGKYPGGYDVNLVQEFMKGACAGLESRDFVERYTWKTRNLADANLGTSSLFNDDGTLTALGTIYAAL